MIINETNVNIIPALLDLVGSGHNMDEAFMNKFQEILELRGFKVHNSVELDICMDEFASLGLVEIYKGSNNKYMIRKK